MRYFIVATTLLLFPACASTTEQLFLEANQSGDWAPVNKRLQEEDERGTARQRCRSGSLLYCEVSLGGERCSCEPERLPQQRMGRELRRFR